MLAFLPQVREDMEMKCEFPGCRSAAMFKTELEDESPVFTCEIHLGCEMIILNAREENSESIR